MCKNCGEEIISEKNKLYCNMSCRDEYWKKTDYNPFKGKKHSKETIKKITSHPNYLNRKIVSPQKGKRISDEHKAILHKYSVKEWNVKYRHDVKYEGPKRIQIIDWCRKHGGNPDLIAEKWFLPCERCGWGEAKCDLHHKVEKKDGGWSSVGNLITLCPNCHRLVHRGLINVK